MQLSPKLILWHLKQEFRLQAPGSFTSEPCLKYAVHYRPGQPFSGGLIYISTEPAEDFLRNPLHSMMILTAFPDQDIPAQTPQYLRHSPGKIRLFLWKRWKKYSVNTRNGISPSLSPG